MSIDRLKVDYLPNPTIEHEQQPSTSANMVDANIKNIVLADKNQSNCVTGNNSNLNQPDIIYHYNDLLRKPKQTRYGRLIQTPQRYID